MGYLLSGEGKEPYKGERISEVRKGISKTERIGVNSKSRNEYYEKNNQLPANFSET
jgi:hypothetical protein